MTKIKYNMENKNSIISNLNGCISKLSVINNNFYNTYFPRDFYYINSLFSMERELITIKKDLNNYKDNINAIMEKINKNELEMASKLSKINELSISRFNS
jgi:CII-binding regulator of phage lambda lysogenization HflD